MLFFVFRYLSPVAVVFAFPASIAVHSERSHSKGAPLLAAQYTLAVDPGGALASSVSASPLVFASASTKASASASAPDSALAPAPASASASALPLEEDNPESLVILRKLRNATGIIEPLLIHEMVMHAATTDTNPWKAIYQARRHHWHKDYAKVGTPLAFMTSAAFRDWVVFFASFPFLVMLHLWMSKRTRILQHHVWALMVWLGVGVAYLCFMRASLGGTPAIHWLTGYFLEFIFTVENVFVFHMVLKSFKADKLATKKALFIVVLFQIFCGAVFYMGLAQRLREMHFLPYLLGVWLLYIGVEAALGDSHKEFDAESTSVYKMIEWCLGSWLSPEYAEGAIFFTKGGERRVSMLGPVIICLIIVDFMLEIDVTLTKIEELDNEYIAFTSSVVASFAMPEIYFVAQDLFQRYPLLKYGISFVLVFFGTQMLFHRFFSIPDLVSCAIMIGVLIFCMFLSSVFGYGSPQEHGLTPAHAECGIGPPVKDNSAHGLALDDSRLPQK